MFSRGMIAGLIISWGAYALAVEDVQVQALFPGMAVVLVDGVRHTLKVGESTPQGVRLVSADSRQAVLDIDGHRASYAPGSAVSLDFDQPEMLQEQVFADAKGMFLAVGSINGQTVRFLVDTGATTIAMNKSQARKLGVRYRLDGEPATASTASGFVRGYRVQLRSVSLGKIRRENVEAVVIDGEHPGPILLGMSFLAALQVEKSGNLLTLKQKK